jgi:hypothetical protein
MAPYLRTWRDGWRHLIFQLAACHVCFFISGTTFIIPMSNWDGKHISRHIKLWSHSILNTKFFFLGILLAGIRTVLMAILARLFSTHHGILSSSRRTSRFEKYFFSEKGLVIGLVLLLASLIELGFLVSNWTGSGFLP